MRVDCLLVFVLLGSVTASAQDWQACKPEGDYSFNDVKAAVHRVMSSRMYTGWDEKTFNRSGDLVAVAVLKTLDDSEMASRESAKWVLQVIRAAFACPQYCVKVTDDRRPRMTLLLLEHLNEITGGNVQTDIEEAKRFILQQAQAPTESDSTYKPIPAFQSPVPASKAARWKESSTKMAYRFGFARKDKTIEVTIVGVTSPFHAI
jgi:hypothetical protein